MYLCVSVSDHNIWHCFCKLSFKVTFFFRNNHVSWYAFYTRASRALPLWEPRLPLLPSARPSCCQLTMFLNICPHRESFSERSYVHPLMSPRHRQFTSWHDNHFPDGANGKGSARAAPAYSLPARWASVSVSPRRTAQEIQETKQAESQCDVSEAGSPPGSSSPVATMTRPNARHWGMLAASSLLLGLPGPCTSV